MNDAERAVLAALNGLRSEWDGNSYASFAWIMSRTGLDRATVRRACRSLARKGRAEYGKGLWNDDGPAGAGYRVVTSMQDSPLV